MLCDMIIYSSGRFPWKMKKKVLIKIDKCSEKIARHIAHTITQLIIIVIIMCVRLVGKCVFLDHRGKRDMLFVDTCFFFLFSISYYLHVFK